MTLGDKKSDASIDRARKATRKKAEAKAPETLSQAYDRMAALKWSDTERTTILDAVFGAIRDGTIQWNGEKFSKKLVYQLYDTLVETRKQKLRQHVIDTRPDNYWIVQDAETLERVREMLRNEPLTAWDTETQGLDIFNHRIVGWSVYMPRADVAVYVPFGHTTGQPQVSEQAAMDVAREYLENPENRTVWHHYKYDGHMFANHGIRVANPWWDTQVVAKLLYEHESHRLKDLYAKYVLRQPDSAIMFEDLFDDHVIYDKDVILAGIYAAGDAHKTYKLMEFQKPYIDTVDNLKTVWYEIEQKLLQVDLDMERTGFRIDLKRMGELEAEFQPVLDDCVRRLKEAFNIDEAFVRRMSEKLGREETEFNIDSNQHLAYLIYDVLGVPEEFPLKMKQVRRSTAAPVLEALCKDYEQLTPLMQYRQLNKLITTYIHKIPKAMEPATGRLHARFNNMSSEDDDSDGTATGRYSSSTYVSGKNSATGDVAKGCNLQNIAAKGVGVEIRKCFIPDDGWVLISADLSQIEPRVIAEILATEFNDRTMLQFYLDGKDLYTEMAMSTFGFPRENCVDGAYDPTGTFQPRKLMKQGVLSYLYGTSVKSFARNMKVSEEIAQKFFDGMLQAFPGLKSFREETIRSLLTNGSVAHVTTLFGRKRRFPDYRRDYAELQKLNRIPRNRMTDDQKQRRNELWRKCAEVERQAINTRVQGTAADVLKQNMIHIHRWIRENGYQLNASIHDEVIISVPKRDLTPELIRTINDFMTRTVKFHVPLKTDIVIMERWMDECKPLDWDFERQQPKEREVA